jgi:hypothetical protein
MKPGLIIIGVVIVIGIIFFVSKSSGNKKPLIQVARQIKLDQLETVMEQLISKNLEYDFFGITSNGIDCIYFVDNSGKLNIEFEVMVNEQKPFVDKIKEFAETSGYKVIKTTYGNKPRYDDLKEAPVYKIEINADTKTATEIGTRIMTEIFKCDMTTKFDVVP